MRQIQVRRGKGAMECGQLSKGEGGAPQEAQDWMHSLVDEYNDIGSRLKTSGLNGDVLSLAPWIVNQEPLPVDEEAQVEKILQNKGMTKAGKLYKAGIVMANSRVILEAHRRWGEMVDKDK